MSGSAHSGFPEGNATVDPKVNGFDPSVVLRDFDWGKTRRLADGGTLREWELVAYDKEIEIVPGVKYAAWTYNGRIPAPVIESCEGDKVIINMNNKGTTAHGFDTHAMKIEARHYSPVAPGNGI